MTGLNLHEQKSEISLDYTGVFDLNGSMIIGSIEHKTLKKASEIWMILKVLQTQ